MTGRLLSMRGITSDAMSDINHNNQYGQHFHGLSHKINQFSIASKHIAGTY